MNDIKPQKITDADALFGGQVDSLMPAYQDIPKEFRNGRTKWNDLFSDWFFEGLPAGTQFIPKAGIDKSEALRHIRTIMSSFKPDHNHKEACCAYLMSLWFDKIDTGGKQNEGEQDGK